MQNLKPQFLIVGNLVRSTIRVHCTVYHSQNYGVIYFSKITRLLEYNLSEPLSRMFSRMYLERISKNKSLIQHIVMCNLGFRPTYLTTRVLSAEGVF